MATKPVYASIASDRHLDPTRHAQAIVRGAWAADNRIAAPVTYQTEAWLADDGDGRAQLWAAAFLVEHPEVRVRARARDVVALGPLWLVADATVEVLREQAALALFDHLAKGAACPS